MTARTQGCFAGRDGAPTGLLRWPRRRSHGTASLAETARPQDCFAGRDGAPTGLLRWPKRRAHRTASLIEAARVVTIRRRKKTDASRRTASLVGRRFARFRAPFTRDNSLSSRMCRRRPVVARCRVVAGDPTASRDKGDRATGKRRGTVLLRHDGHVMSGTADRRFRRGRHRDAHSAVYPVTVVVRLATGTMLDAATVRGRRGLGADARVR